MKDLANKLFIICICMIFVFTLAGCKKEEANGSLKLYIPIIADQSWLTSDGAFLNGAQLGADEFNKEYKEKGISVTIEVIDDQALYETGVEKATEVAEDAAVTAIFNLQNFDVSETSAGILSEHKKLTVFPYGAYDSLFNQDNPYVFCPVPAFKDLGLAMADYGVKQGYKRFAIYHNGIKSQEELVTAFELALMDTDAKVVDYVPSIASQNQFNDIYKRWQTLGVDCVVISQYGLERAFEVLSMLRDSDTHIAVLGEPIFNRANALDIYKDIAEGMAVPSTLVINESNRLTVLEEQYKEKFHKEADIWAVQGYDMVRMIADTAASLNTDNPEVIAKALHEEKGYQGVGRTICFDKGGALIMKDTTLPILKCKNGRFE